MKISEEERWYLQARWGLLRAAQEKADDASRRWNVLNEKITIWLAKMKIDDVVQKDKVKNQNLTLKGHLSTWDFHQRDANRYAQEILAFEAMKRMEAL